MVFLLLNIVRLGEKWEERSGSDFHLCEPFFPADDLSNFKICHLWGHPQILVINGGVGLHIMQGKDQTKIDNCHDSLDSLACLNFGVNKLS